MIIFRYLARDLLAITGAVCAVLLLVVISSRFVKYLADAAAGYLDANILFALIGYRIPGFLELILPLAFFLAILLAYGRMYVDSEMTVLFACGMSKNTLLGYTMAVALAIAVLVGWLSLSVSPGGLAKVDALFQAQTQRDEFDGVEAGKFYQLREERGVTYAESIDAQRKLHNVFLAESGGEESKDPRLVIVVAASGSPRTAQANGESYLVLEDGYRIQGVPGRADFQVTAFKEYGQRLARPRENNKLSVRSLPTRQLWNSNDPKYIATLQWRYSVPMLVLVVSLMAVPLSRANPRAGRFVKILPAVLLYILYLVALNGAKSYLEEGKLSPWIGLWFVHLIFLAVAAGLLAWDNGWRPRWSLLRRWTA